jgi:hypothetical protein
LPEKSTSQSKPLLTVIDKMKIKPWRVPTTFSLLEIHTHGIQSISKCIIVQTCASNTNDTKNSIILAKQVMIVLAKQTHLLDKPCNKLHFSPCERSEFLPDSKPFLASELENLKAKNWI